MQIELNENSMQSLAKKLGAYALAAGAALGAMATSANAYVVSYTGPANELVNPDGLPDGLVDPDGIPGNGDDYYNPYDSYYTRYPRLPMTDPDGIPGNDDDYSDIPGNFGIGDHGWYGVSPESFGTDNPGDPVGHEYVGQPTVVYPLILLQLDGTVLETWETDPSGGPENTLWPEAASDSVWFSREVDDWDDLYISTLFPHDPMEDTTYFSASADASVGLDHLDAGFVIDSSYDFTAGALGGEDNSKHQVLNSFNGRKIQGDPHWWGRSAPYDGYLAFEIDGHYGWAHIDVSDPRNDVVVYEYAYETVPGMAITAGQMAIPPEGDFEPDGDVDADDIDILCDNMGSLDPLYDLDNGTGTGTADGVVDEIDLIYLIEYLAEWDNGVDTGTGTKQGDFNLDGVVNATDLAIMKGTFGASGVGYAAGNANCDTVVNATDLAILKGSFGFVATPGGGVPEPATLTLLALGAAGLAAKRRRKS